MNTKTTFRRVLSLVTAAVATVSLLSACGTDSSSADTEHIQKLALETAQKAVADKVLSTGPHGEKAAAASVADLSSTEIQKIKAAHLTAALVFHYSGNDWYNGQVAGLKSEAQKLGVKIISITGANFNANTQVSQLETVMAQKPDIVISIPTDATATAQAYKAVAQAGTTLVFMDQPANGLVPGKDYVSVVSADNYGNGVASAHILAKSIGGKGDIAALYYDADFFATNERYAGFTDTIKKDYPDIHIVAKGPVSDSDLVGTAQNQASAIIQKHPDLKGMWAPWDVPAEGAMAAARAAGRTDLKIATEDLGESIAVAMAQNQLIVGTSAQRCFDQGVTEMRIAAGARVLHRTYPSYVALPAYPITRVNLASAWKGVFASPLPATVANILNKK